MGKNKVLESPWLETENHHQVQGHYTPGLLGVLKGEQKGTSLEIQQIRLVLKMHYTSFSPNPTEETVLAGTLSNCNLLRIMCSFISRNPAKTANLAEPLRLAVTAQGPARPALLVNKHPKIDRFVSLGNSHHCTLPGLGTSHFLYRKSYRVVQNG